MLIHAPISLGELVDKITILEIKAQNITDASRLGNVRNELDALNHLLTQLFGASQRDELAPLKTTLREVNEELWRIEDDIRDCERKQQFDDTFTQLARSVYFRNDWRAAVKKEINLRFGSELIEEKSYRDYGS